MDQKYFDQIKHARFNEHIYFLGNYESRITVHSQQIRATNLVYSLHKLGLLKESTKIGIIGAGTAGLMVAATSALLGCKHIRIFEQGADLLPLWRDCSSRWLDPTIFDWPNPRWRNSATNLPVLNWKADKAVAVATQIENEWNTLYDYYKAKANFDVKLSTTASVVANSNRIVSGKFGEKDDFDLIFLCVGFGRDGNNNDENTCYWANDNLQSAKGKYFVSGVGDGGIADLLRIRIKGYDLTWLRTQLHTEEIHVIENQIKEIENEAMSLQLRKGIKAVDQFLHQSYESIKTPHLCKALGERLRKDTKIHFHSHNENYYKLNAFPLNRFMLSRYLQLKDTNFNFVHGEFKNLAAVKRSKANSSLKINFVGQPTVTTDTFISRHGPKTPLLENGLNWIDTSPESEEIRARNKLDQTGRYPIFNNIDFKTASDYLQKVGAPLKERIAIAIVKHKRKKMYLLTKRKIKEAHLDWGFPAKRVRAGYDVQKALTLECEHETGIVPKNLTFIGQRFHEATGHHLEYWYCEHDKGRLKLKDTNELSAVKWMGGAEIVGMIEDLFEPLKEILK